MAQRRIVVVGHGAAGLCAAISAVEFAAEQGIDARVTIVDRATEGACGGNSRWSPSNIRMRSPDAMEPGFVEDIVAQSGGRVDRAYFERLADEAPPTLRWLQSKGVEFARPPYYLSRGPTRIQPVGGGAVLFDALWRSAKAAGIEFLYRHNLRRLKVDSGRVVGVEVEPERGIGPQVESQPGLGVETAPSPAALHADAVVLACGGFEGNGEMLRRHFGTGAEQFRPLSPGTSFNDGAGIRVALEAGARRSGDWNGMHAEPVDARSRASAPVVLVYPYGIVVDRVGRRFFDEGAGLVHETWEKFARDLHFSLPGRIAYAILDAALLDIPEYGRAIRSELPPVRGDSMAELAEQLGIPAAALTDTVRAYNAACTGNPSCFDETRLDGLASAPGLSPRKSNWARALVRAPFLAWPVVGAIAYTFGGIETDTEGRVIGNAGPLPGLYAAGEITGHFHGTAPNAVAMLRALVFGRIAGRNAVRLG